MTDARHIEATGSSGGRSSSTSEVMRKPRSGDLTVPYAELEGVEGLATGFRQQMLGIEIGGEEIGNVATGAGLGNDFITLRWGDRMVIVRGIDLLRAWMATFDPEAAKRLPEGLGAKS
jgi:hypothetical protein